MDVKGVRMNCIRDVKEVFQGCYILPEEVFLPPPASPLLSSILGSQSVNDGILGVQLAASGTQINGL